MDRNGVMEFLGRFVSDTGATGSAGGVVIGHRLGLYRSLAEGRHERRRTGGNSTGVGRWSLPRPQGLVTALGGGYASLFSGLPAEATAWPG